MPRKKQTLQFVKRMVEFDQLVVNANQLGDLPILTIAALSVQHLTHDGAVLLRDRINEWLNENFDNEAV